MGLDGKEGLTTMPLELPRHTQTEREREEEEEEEEGRVWTTLWTEQKGTDGPYPTIDVVAL